MRISNTCLAKINLLMNNTVFSNPEYKQRAFSAIRQIVKQTYSVARAASVQWMFNVLISKKLVLNPVKSLCRKLYHGIRADEKRAQLGMKVMCMKFDDARACPYREGEEIV